MNFAMSCAPGRHRKRVKPVHFCGVPLLSIPFATYLSISGAARSGVLRHLKSRCAWNIHIVPLCICIFVSGSGGRLARRAESRVTTTGRYVLPRPAPPRAQKRTAPGTVPAVTSVACICLTSPSSRFYDRENTCKPGTSKVTGARRGPTCHASGALPEVRPLVWLVRMESLAAD